MRSLPSGTTWPGMLHPRLESKPNDRLDLAQDLGDLSVSGRAEVLGTIGDGTGPSPEVDWYQFNLDRATNVTLATLPGSGSNLAVPVLSLYNSDPNDAGDPYDPLGHRLMAQDDGGTHGGMAQIDRSLAPGTYYVAVSGSGNLYFHPFLADSGSPGSSGDYGLQITGNEQGFDPADGPAVLASEPASAAVLDHSPLLLRVDLSAALDPNTILPDQTVRLIYNGAGTFGQGGDQPIAQAGPPNFSSASDELQLLPATALVPGFYELVLAGDSSTGQSVLADATGTPLGKNADHPSGQDFILSFQINGVDGNSVNAQTGDDTLATAHVLGDLTTGQLLQLAGAIGDNSAANPNATDPPPNPANDVDLYHFHVAGPGRYAFSAEAFAGRIGSPLDPALSLFRASSGVSQLQLVTLNDNTLNDSQATNGTLPLYTDAAVFAGLTEGDYYLAVSSGGNLPDPTLAPVPGTTGRIFDSTNSNQAGSTTGNYLLNLLLVPAAETPPQVVAVTPSDGTMITAPPTEVTVQFNEVVNLPQMAFQSMQNTSTGELPAVYIVGADGNKYFPRLTSYDTSTKRATFMMLDALPNGVNELHLSGPMGLTDLAGVPLAGNDPSEDFVVRFSVEGPERGTGGNPLIWSAQEPHDGLSQPQNLGVLFPHELERHVGQAGVSFVRGLPNAAASSDSDDTTDYYQFQLLQSRPYFFKLTGSALPDGTQPSLTDVSGTPIHLMPQGNGSVSLANLDAGTYVVRVGGWTADQAANVQYQLTISLGGSVENPTPLTIGPAPAYRLVLASYTTSPSPTPPVANPTPVPTPAPAITPPSPTPITGVPTPPAPPAVVVMSPASPAAVVTSPPSPTAVVTTLLLSPPIIGTTLPPASSTAPPSAVTLPLPALAPAVTPPAPTPVVVNLPAPPASPVPPPRVELPLPASANTSAAGVSVANAPAINQTSLVPAIPADVLLAMRATPIGGVRGASPGDVPSAPERVVLRGPDPTLIEGQLRMTILTQSATFHPPIQQDSGTVMSEDPPRATSTARTPIEPSQEAARSSRAELATIVKQSLRILETLWKHALESLFKEGAGSRPADGLTAPPAAPMQSLPQKDEGPPNNGQGEQDGLGAAASGFSMDDAASSASAEWEWASAVLGVGACAFVNPAGDSAERRRSVLANGKY